LNLTHRLESWQGLARQDSDFVQMGKPPDRQETGM